MKALILAAGFGERLLPYTRHTPKPLFTICGRPLLDIMIRQLISAGCTSVMINTHHLAERIAEFLSARTYPIPVQTRREPEILGTGGAVKNLSDFWDDAPFMVVNSDILTDIDLGAVYAHHQKEGGMAALALVDDPRFNTVSAGRDGRVAGFAGVNPDAAGKADAPPCRRLTFTGVQALDPEILSHIPDNRFCSIIDVYADLISQGRKIGCYVPENARWTDVGTPERYHAAAFAAMARSAFGRMSPGAPNEDIHATCLAGDGSDRRWRRLTARGASVVAADHGIRKDISVAEVDAFVHIGGHLRGKGVPVPEIYLYDTFSGLVFMEDLGDVRLHDRIIERREPEKVLKDYQAAIDLLMHMHAKGAEGFDPSWTWQTAAYDREVILNAECRYFVDAYLKGCRGLAVGFDRLEREFNRLADRIAQCAYAGFMHRDFQSRNIMISGGKFHVIDFQGGRLGPLQYDLASLLIDPYAGLDDDIQARLLTYCVDRLPKTGGVSAGAFEDGYAHCALSRNLQILGAFGFLSRVKGKRFFDRFIPPALEGLKMRLSCFGGAEFRRLKEIAERL